MVTQPIWRQFSSLDLRRAFVTAEKLRESNSHLVSSSSSRLRSRCCNKSGGPILDMKMESPASAILPVLLLFFLTYEISSLKVLNRELEAVAGVGVSHWLHADLNPHCSLPECAANATGAVPTIVNLTVQEEPAPVLERHWLWAVLGRPCMQVALTSPEAVAQVDWEALMGGQDLDDSIGYSSTPKYSAAVMLAALIEYNDKKNLGYLDENNAQVIRYPIENFSWRRIRLESNTELAAYAFIGENYTSESLVLNAGSKPHGMITAGKLNITMSAYAYEGFAHWLPHLTISDSTNQMDIQLDGIITNSGYNYSRYILEFYLVSNAQNISADIEWLSTRTLDDEHTPGIFNTQELVIPGFNESLQTYLQWRPVVYTTSARDLTASTDVNVSHHAEIVRRPEVTLTQTVLFAMYGQDLQDMVVRGVNVSLGSRGDGFYKKTKFQAWTFTLGTGKPIHNAISPLVFLVLVAMLSVCIIVALVASCICIAKKCKKGRQAVPYATIEGEEET